MKLRVGFYAKRELVLIQCDGLEKGVGHEADGKVDGDKKEDG